MPADLKLRFRYAANPVRQALYFCRGELIQAIGELSEAYGRDWRQAVGAVHLAVDAPANKRFKYRVEAVLQDLETQFPAAFYLPLTFTRKQTVAQVVVGLADGEGNLVRFYANTHDTVYTGIQSHRCLCCVTSNYQGPTAKRNCPCCLRFRRPIWRIISAPAVRESMCAMYWAA